MRLLGIFVIAISLLAMANVASHSQTEEPDEKTCQVILTLEGYKATPDHGFAEPFDAEIKIGDEDFEEITDDGYPFLKSIPFILSTRTAESGSTIDISVRVEDQLHDSSDVTYERVSTTKSLSFDISCSNKHIEEENIRALLEDDNVDEWWVHHFDFQAIILPEEG